MRERRGRAAAAARLAANRKANINNSNFLSRATRARKRSCESNQLSKRVKPGPWAALVTRRPRKVKAPSVSIYASSRT